MTKCVYILALLILCCGVNSTFAQAKPKPRVGIVLKLSVDDPATDIYFIPLNVNKIGSTRNEGGGVAKDYGPDYEGPALPPGYSYKWKASVFDKSRTKIKLWIWDVDDGLRIVNGSLVGCSTRKEFFVRRHRQTQRRIGCKAKVTAYYGFEPAEVKQE